MAFEKKNETTAKHCKCFEHYIISSCAVINNEMDPNEGEKIGWQLMCGRWFVFD